MSETVVALEGLSFAYGPEHPVLCDCRLRIAAGERVGLVGANGSGKSTLLLLLVGLLRPTAGRIELVGQPCSTEKDFQAIRGRVGLLFQDSDDQLFCPTVADDVAFGPLNLGRTPREARELVEQSLARVGLAGYESRVTYRLSGGEKRLVALATVLAMSPEVLLLDEPTAGLDEASCARIESLLLDLPQAMLVVAHDRPLLTRVCHRLVELSAGRLG